MKFFRRALLYCLIGLATFVVGVTIQKYKYFPYYQFDNLAKIAIRRSYQSPDVVLSRQYIRDTDKVDADKRIDTVLLPLKVKTIRLSEQFPAPKVGGSITTVGDTIIVMDRLGNIYSCKSDHSGFEKLSFPPLPNNVVEYLHYPDTRLDTKMFRAYNIIYVKSAKLFAVSHEFFDTQAHKTRTALSTIEVEPESLRPVGQWKTIFYGDLEPDWSTDISGNKLTTDASGTVYMSVGNYEIDNYPWQKPIIQDPNSRFGKIFAINPLTGDFRKISTGHRNPQGLLLTKDGRFFSTEQGPAGGDELNLIEEGSNYGWPNVTLGVDYGSYGWPYEGQDQVGRHAGGYKAPIFAWNPTIAVSNLIQVEGFNPRWDGDLLIGSLKAQTLFHIRLEEGPRVLYSEPIWIGQRIRDILQLKDGTIVLWTDDTQLEFISPDREKLDANRRVVASVGDTTVAACMYCHHFGPTSVSDPAPSLSNLLGRKIGSDNYRYSAALRNKEGVWTKERLSEFLSNTSAFASGTSMPTPPLTKDQIHEIVDTLEHAPGGQLEQHHAGNAHGPD